MHYVTGSSNIPGMTTGQIIRELRLGAGLTQEELAIAVGNTRFLVSNWETDKQTPSVPKLLALGSILNVPIDRFFETDVAPAQHLKEDAA